MGFDFHSQVASNFVPFLSTCFGKYMPDKCSRETYSDTLPTMFIGIPSVGSDYALLDNFSATLSPLTREIPRWGAVNIVFSA